MTNLRRKLGVLLAASTVGTVFQANGCTDYTTQLVVSALDLCSVLNCNGSSFFNPCAPNVLFVDCPVQEVQP